jgi:hypothetical protein
MRRAFRFARAMFVIAPLTITLACGDDSGKTDDGGGPGKDVPISTTCPKGVDTSTDIDSAIALTRDQEQDEYICPKGDKDYYTVEVGAGEALLNIKLRPTSPISTVQLSYRLIQKDGQGEKAVGSSTPGLGQFDALHCLAPGSYYVIVEDEGNDALDGDNAYKIAFTGIADKDANEPNNDQASAVAVSGPATGYISCVGDVDYYKITTKQNELLKINLSTAKTTIVDLKYTLYDSKGDPIADEHVADGSKKPTTLETIYALPGAGTYYVKVEDYATDKQGQETTGDDNDAETPYTLTLTPQAEQDPQDIGTRNDHPKTATKLGTTTGNESCASPFTKTITGRIGSLADIDTFEINLPASVTATNPQVMQVELAFNGATKVDPSIEMLRSDATTSCQEDRCCAVLGAGHTSCSDSFACSANSFSCVTRGTSFCSNCVTNPEPGCAQNRACAGAVLCLANSTCAYTRWIRQKTDGARIKTAHPINQGGTVYLRVADLAGDEYDPNTTYTLTVKICKDPDPREPDNGYFPHLNIYSNKKPEPFPGYTENQINSYFRKQDNSALSKAPTVTIPASGWSASTEGYLSYEHDVDYVKLTNPCHGAVCMLEADYSVSGGCTKSEMSNGVKYHFTVYKSGGIGGLGDDFPRPLVANPSGTFGYNGSSGPCAMLLRPGMASTLILRVDQPNHNDWDFDCKYSVRFRVSHTGCPEPPCKVNPPDGQCITN